jgi:hypothetical protein
LYACGLIAVVMAPKVAQKKVKRPPDDHRSEVSYRPDSAVFKLGAFAQALLTPYQVVPGKKLKLACDCAGMDMPVTCATIILGKPNVEQLMATERDLVAVRYHLLHHSADHLFSSAEGASKPGVT